MKQYRSLFGNRNFVLHWLAGAISNVGDFFNSLALLKILSEDPAHLGLYMALIMVAKVLPGVLLGPVSGVMADRLSRKAVMIVSDLLRAVLILGLVVAQQPVQILTLVALAAVVSAFFNPASGAMMPSLVAKEELVTAGSLGVMTQRMAMLLGNGMGAVVLAMAGAHNVFYIDAASFVVSALLVAGIRLRGNAPAHAAAAGAGVEPGVEAREGAGVEPGVEAGVEAGEGAGAQAGAPGFWGKFRGDLAEAMAFLRQSPLVRRLMGTLAIAAIGDSALNVLLITFFTVGLGLAAESIGLIWALFGGASVLGALVIGALGHRVPWRYLISFGGGYIWFVMMGALLTESVIPSIIFLTLRGLGSGAINVGFQAAVGELVPDYVRGRVFGAWGMVQNLIYVVGVLSAGWFSDSFGPTRTLMGYTTFYLLAGIYAFLAFRSRPGQDQQPAIAVAE